MRLLSGEVTPELKSDRWVQVSEVRVEEDVRELTWVGGRESANQALRQTSKARTTGLTKYQAYAVRSFIIKCR